MYLLLNHHFLYHLNKINNIINGLNLLITKSIIVHNIVINIFLLLSVLEYNRHLQEMYGCVSTNIAMIVTGINKIKKTILLSLHVLSSLS